MEIYIDDTPTYGTNSKITNKKNRKIFGNKAKKSKLMLMIVIKSTGVIRMQQKSIGTRKDTWSHLEQDCFKKAYKLPTRAHSPQRVFSVVRRTKSITTTLEEVNFRNENRITSDPQSLFTDEVYKDILFDLDEKISRRTTMHNPSRVDER